MLRLTAVCFYDILKAAEKKVSVITRQGELHENIIRIRAFRRPGGLRKVTPHSSQKVG